MSGVAPESGDDAFMPDGPEMAQPGASDAARAGNLADVSAEQSELNERDRQLIRRAIAGDHGALREVWNTHRRWVAAVLIAHKPRSADVDDLLQEVAVAVVAKISGLRDPAAFKPWLRAVAMSLAKTAARRSNVRAAGVQRVVDQARAMDQSGDPSGSSTDDALAQGRRLLELAADIPDGYREPLILKCVQGMSYKQIGQVMGLPDTTVETRIARARRMLRDRAMALAATDPSAAASALVSPQASSSAAGVHEPGAPRKTSSGVDR